MKTDKAHDVNVGKEFNIDVGEGWTVKTGKTITIQSGSMQKIVIKSGGDLELQASPAGNVKINGKQVDITGTIGVNVKGASINLG